MFCMYLTFHLKLLKLNNLKINFNPFLPSFLQLCQSVLYFIITVVLFKASFITFSAVIFIFELGQLQFKKK